LSYNALATRITPNDEFHGLTTGSAFFYGATDNAAGKRADYTAHGARAPIAANGTAQEAATNSACGRADTAARPTDSNGAHGNDGAAIYRALNAKRLTFNRGVRRRRAGGNAEKQKKCRKAQKHWSVSASGGVTKGS
jgi:hypothetical protein